MKRRSIALILVILLAAGIIGCGGNMVRRQVENSVAKSLPGLIGPAQSYTVRAYGSTLRMIHGKLDGLDIVGTNVVLPNKMNLARLDVKIRDLAINTGSKKIERVGATNFSATLDQSELMRCTSERYSDVNIVLREGFLTLSARPGISRLRMGVQIDAELEIRDRRILALNLRKLKVGGIKAPGFARDLVESRLDTVFDANDIGYDARLDSAAITPGLLTLTGTLDLMKAGGNGRGGS